MKTNKDYIVKDTFIAHTPCPECGSKRMMVIQLKDYKKNMVMEHIACCECEYIHEPGIEIGEIPAYDIRVLKVKADAFDAIMGDEALTNYFENWYLKSSDRYKTIKKGIDAFNRGRVDE